MRATPVQTGFLEQPMENVRQLKPLRQKVTAAPKHLRAATREWFDGVVATYALEEHHLRLLTLAAESWDAGELARLALAQHGQTFTDRFGQPHARPEVAIQRDATIAFSRLFRELDLDAAVTPAASRPPSIRSNRGQ
jgi:phage terminase small subunit